MSINRFRYLFKQFINKTASEAEIQEFLHMMNGEGYDEEIKVLLNEFWNEVSIDAAIDEGRADQLFRKILESKQDNVLNLFNNRTFWYKSIAALLILGLSSLFYWSQSNYTEPSVVKVEKLDLNPINIPARRFINLPDGSSVIVNENSRVELSKNFNSNGLREVHLYGEAYFDVVHDPKKPFIVYAGKVKTTVLGTSFNVKESSLAKTVTVTVTRGKVKVGNNKKTYNIIVPDEQVVIDESSFEHIKKPVKAVSVIEWTNEDIYFDDVSIKDVAKQLQERFNVSIVFSNEQIKSCRFSATFMKSQSLSQILEVIGEFNQIKYQIKDNNKVVVLDGSGCR
jgi:ferric-dicitrate binding protein FerR (iron transport regulator)